VPPLALSLSHNLSDREDKFLHAQPGRAIRNRHSRAERQGNPSSHGRLILVYLESVILSNYGIVRENNLADHSCSHEKRISLTSTTVLSGVAAGRNARKTTSNIGSKGKDSICTLPFLRVPGPSMSVSLSHSPGTSTHLSSA
jgi:hypothetical protein